MRRTILGGLASAAALLAVVAAAPAEATPPAGPLSPSTVKLATSSGTQNGCVATIPKFTLADLTIPGGKSPGIAMNANLKCPASAKVGRVTWKIWLFKVHKGWLEGMNGPAGLLTSGARLFDPALKGSYSPFDEFGVLCGPDHPQNAGTNTWLMRATYHTHHSKTDPVPFIGHVDRQQTVTC
jgi:hypothetical protein